MEAAFIAVYNSIMHRAFRTAKSILTQPELAKNEELRINVSDAFNVVAVSAGLRTMALLECSPGWVSPLSNLYVARYAHPTLVKHNQYSYIIANKDKISEKRLLQLWRRIARRIYLLSNVLVNCLGIFNLLVVVMESSSIPYLQPCAFQMIFVNLSNGVLKGCMKSPLN